MPVRNLAQSCSGNGHACAVFALSSRPIRQWRTGMNFTMWRTLAAAALATTVAGSALAQQPAPVRVRGQIEKVDGNTLTVKARDGAPLTVSMTDNVRVMSFVKATLADIKPNSYIGVTAMPQADGSQKAIAI